MLRLLKWLAALIGVAVVIACGSYFYLNHKADQRLAQRYSFNVQVPDIPVDSTLIARGEHISKIWGCADCHSGDFSGKEVVPAGNPVAHVVAPNITKGVGGLPEQYSNEDWARAIRYGITPEGRALYVMPSRDWTGMSDYDVNALIAYMQQVPKVDNTMPPSTLGPLGKLLAGAGQLKMWEAESVDPSIQPNNTVIPAATAEYGAYLSANCAGCHRPDFKGGPSLLDPSFPFVPDLTPSGESASWTKEQFIAAFTTGKRPDGRQMDTYFMPWMTFSNLTEMERDALYAFFESLP